MELTLLESTVHSMANKLVSQELFIEPLISRNASWNDILQKLDWSEIRIDV